MDTRKISATVFKEDLVSLVRSMAGFAVGSLLSSSLGSSQGERYAVK
jgi:hypothetical protein